ncbi:hypothetical protein C8J35_105147 [Rhizobium sp. PP-F2F-G38]|nr:hypothetical protein [Ferranicluibacter rubi]PYE32987.1 hypothetical protein C8J37_106148 [Rhizobium sp. PP-WC-1G-195]PYE97036.1 hypothetical protein C8J35_105147 [Rhizobium sp. PP-F2F-G38]
MTIAQFMTFLITPAAAIGFGLVMLRITRRDQKRELAKKHAH